MPNVTPPHPSESGNKPSYSEVVSPISPQPPNRGFLGGRVNHEESIVKVENISFGYGDGEEILDGVSFSIHRGDYLGIVGPNGAGKTTLLKIILGLLPPTSGTVRLFDQDQAKFRDWQKIGYVPQKATNFDANFPATVKEIVSMGRYARRGMFRSLTREDQKIVERSLLEVEMWDFRDRLIGDLSGGQQQRVFVARALAGEPEIIFLDEPTVGIDTRIRKEFYDLLRKLNKDYGLTLVLVSHNLDVISEEAMHVACINRKLEYFGTVSEFLSKGHLQEVAGIKFLSSYHGH